MTTARPRQRNILVQQKNLDPDIKIQSWWDVLVVCWTREVNGIQPRYN